MTVPIRRRGFRAVLAAGLVCGLPLGVAVPPVRAQAPAADLARAIDNLGDFDHAVRVEASRVVRRTPVDVAAPALIEAARSHEDSYVQFRAAALLAGLGDERSRAFFHDALDSPNDRVRAAAYGDAEHRPDPALAPRLLAALEWETSEFVRPALIRALAAHDEEPAVRDRLVKDVDRGEGHFRSAVIEALGDHGAGYGMEPLLRLASEEGPLRDDALLALGKIGDGRALPTIAAAQAEAEDGLQPIVSAAACLLGADCQNQTQYVLDALRYGAASGGAEQALLRSAATAAAALSAAGRPGVLDALFEAGMPSVDPARAPIALAVGTVALRAPQRMLAALAGRDDLDGRLLLLRDAFDMLDEDLAEERFYALMRRTYWDERQPAGARSAAEAAIRMLEF